MASVTIDETPIIEDPVIDETPVVEDEPTPTYPPFTLDTSTWVVTDQIITTDYTTTFPTKSVYDVDGFASVAMYKDVDRYEVSEPGVYDLPLATNGFFRIVVMPNNIVSRSSTVNDTTETITIVYDGPNYRKQLVFDMPYTAPVITPQLTLDDLNDAILALTDLVMGV